MKKKNVSVVSIGKYFNVVDEVIEELNRAGYVEMKLTPEKDNQYDKDAVEVFALLPSGPKKVGYVSANPHYVLENAIGVRDPEFKEIIKDKEMIFAKLYPESSKQLQRSIYCFAVEPKDESEPKVEDLVVSGSLTVYEKRRDLIRDINFHVNVKLEAKRDNRFKNKVVYNVHYDGRPVGILSEGESLKAYGDEFELLTTKHDKGLIYVEINSEKKEVVVDDDIIQSKIDEVISKGIIEEEEINKRVEYMKNNNVPDLILVKILESYHNYPEEIKAKIPNPQTLYIDETGLVSKSLTYLVLENNLKFEGERGTGKNVLTETIAWLTNRPLYEFPMNSQHSNASLFGSLTFKEDNSNALVFNRSTLTEAFEEGGILVLDEFNTALPHVVSMLNGMLDQRRRQYVPDYGTVNGHKNFIAISTENKNYTGTFETNEATSDRFVPIIFPNLESLENVLREYSPNINRKTLVACDRLFESIKDGVNIGTLEDSALTVRGFISVALAVELGLPLKETLIDNIANRASDLDDRESIKAMIDMLLA